MELYLDGDNVQKGAKLARYSGTRILGDDLRRLRKENDNHIIEGHYVVQRKHSDIFVDTEHENIMAKYANHSCRPNCELQEWVGSKGPELFLIASKLIERGDPITFEYNPKDAPTSVRVRFNEQVHGQGICYCASLSCRWTPSEAIQGALDWIEKQCQYPDHWDNIAPEPNTCTLYFKLTIECQGSTPPCEKAVGRQIVNKSVTEDRRKQSLQLEGHWDILFLPTVSPTQRQGC